MILYFSGTGNSALLAKRLSDTLNDSCEDLFPYIRKGEYPAFESDTPYVLVLPTYSWRIPRFISEFLKQSTFYGNKDVYVVLNCGTDTGAAWDYAQEELTSRGLTFKGLYTVVMPENYLALFSVPNDEESRRIIEKGLAAIDDFAELVKGHKPVAKGHITALDRIKSGPVNRLFYQFIVKDKKFYATDACIHCGLCQKVCVLKNIECKEDDKPTWLGHCTHCMACLSKCPVAAIEYGTKTVGKARYHVPERRQL
ncbi:EFR1 family ferrodoxin [Peptoniphilus equinus]|uniref:EFR1 family ferrodoxin n=1 Tax=Peptoniphilus equinus TaxID=3016343 RepID=A0ABY7QVJ7_9FIRM|nr:EFR1 family ferrodoxin [Peptoniphilus equinus]WBW50080.1 EFR1 family ferrodoxin [Peptoniphilus equinus]